MLVPARARVDIFELPVCCFGVLKEISSVGNIGCRVAETSPRKGPWT